MKARDRRPFSELLEEGIRWPSQTATQVAGARPPLPRMISRRHVRCEIPFESTKMPRVVRCESKTERAFYSELDGLRNVLWFQEQPLKVRYSFEGVRKTYCPDTLVALTTGRCFVAEVKEPIGVALFETICKMNGLGSVADDSGFGIFLGDHRSTVVDFLTQEEDVESKRAVLSACDRGGMRSEEWKSIYTRFGVRATSLNAIAFQERLVVTKTPFFVRRGRPDEERSIETFVERFKPRS